MGSRRHGRGGALYASITSGGTAEPIAFLNSWSFASATDREEVTAFEDENKVYVAGFPDASGDFAGFWDSDQNDLYAASQDGVARKFYLYPSRTLDPSDYWYGEALFDFNAAGTTTGGVTISGTWAASGNIQRNSA